VAIVAVVTHDFW